MKKKPCRQCKMVRSSLMAPLNHHAAQQQQNSPSLSLAVLGASFAVVQQHYTAAAPEAAATSYGSVDTIGAVNNHEMTQRTIGSIMQCMQQRPATVTKVMEEQEAESMRGDQQSDIETSAFTTPAHLHREFRHQRRQAERQLPLPLPLPAGTTLRCRFRHHRRPPWRDEAVCDHG
jgi:hypothetical protein